MDFLQCNLLIAKIDKQTMHSSNDFFFLALMLFDSKPTFRLFTDELLVFLVVAASSKIPTISW